MFIKSIISKSKELDKFLKALNIELLLTKKQKGYLVAFIFATILKGYNGKIIDITEIMFERNRTSIGRFLSDSPWDEDLLSKALNKIVLDKMIELSKKTREPIYIIIDDTISKRTQPSSKAKNPIELCGYHFSHLEGKKVYGHQLFVATIQCGNSILPLYIGVYEKSKRSKIEMAIDIIKSLPKAPNGGFVLCDSWYSGENLINAVKKVGYIYVGALKTNRIVYPKFCTSFGVRISDISKHLKSSDVNLVKA